MNQAQSVAPSLKLKPRHFYITGKISEVRFHDGYNYTSVVCPAEDEYSYPNTIEIRSKKKIDNVGAVIEDIECFVVGFTERFSYIDKSTGEAIKGKSSKHFVHFVE